MLAFSLVKSFALSIHNSFYTFWVIINNIFAAQVQTFLSKKYQCFNNSEGILLPLYIRNKNQLLKLNDKMMQDYQQVQQAMIIVQSQLKQPIDVLIKITNVFEQQKFRNYINEEYIDVVAKNTSVIKMKKLVQLPQCNVYLKQIRTKNSQVLASKHKKITYLDQRDDIMRFVVSKMLKKFMTYPLAEQNRILGSIDYTKILEEFYCQKVNKIAFLPTKLPTIFEFESY